MEVRLPHLGEEADSGTVASILVHVGDTVEREQPLIELESEKAVASVPSPARGRVTAVHVREGDEIRTGALIVTLEGAADEAPVADASDASDGTERRDEQPDAGSGRAPEGPAAPGEQMPFPPTEPRMGPVTTKPPSPPRPDTERPLPEGVAPAASPSIRKMARDLGIDLSEIRGTARGGRIVLGDLRDYIARLRNRSGAPQLEKKAPEASAPADFSRWGPVEQVPESATRKTIAARMTESWRRVPHVTQFDDADITDLEALRRRYSPAYSEKGARLTLTPVILKVLARVLERHPLLNSSLDEESSTIVMKGYYHFGLAVDTEAGLIVPVIRDVDRKSILELAREVREIGERARQRRVTREELHGGSFTVSNQGGIGGAHFTPIINYPEVAILGIGRSREQVRLVEGAPESRLILPLALSHDHRVVDGADGVRFLVDLVGELETFPASEFELT